MTKYNAEVSDAHQALLPVLQKVSELKRRVGTSLHCNMPTFCLYWSVIDDEIFKCNNLNLLQEIIRFVLVSMLSIMKKEKTGV